MDKRGNVFFAETLMTFYQISDTKKVRKEKIVHANYRKLGSQCRVCVWSIMYFIAKLGDVQV